MQCPLCSHEAPDGDFGDPAKCPACGVYYHKALANKERLDKARQVEAAKSIRVVTPAPKRRIGPMYCPACGSTKGARTHTRGSILVELFLWLCFLLPGFIYSIWRLSSRQQVCCECGNPGLIPSSSPRAQKELGA